ncbi:hypothetical protein GCM10008085_26310 [Winogradskyella epiphytica]|nr:hypothetical protein GCM10008085_26310 [Winogradskyella epiphytica]
MITVLVDVIIIEEEIIADVITDVMIVNQEKIREKINYLLHLKTIKNPSRKLDGFLLFYQQANVKI